MEVVPIKVDETSTAMITLNDTSMGEPLPDSESIIGMPSIFSSFSRHYSYILSLCHSSLALPEGPTAPDTSLSIFFWYPPLFPMFSFYSALLFSYSLLHYVGVQQYGISISSLLRKLVLIILYFVSIAFSLALLIF